jgi:hypothetical protein
MTTAELTTKRKDLWSRMREMLDRARDEKRDLTTEEAREFDRLETELNECVNELHNGGVAQRQASLHTSAGFDRGDSIGSHIWRGMKDAGFDRRTNPHVELRAWPSPVQTSSLGTGALNRSHFLWPLMRRAPVDSLGISDFSVGTRTVTGTVERTTPMVTTDKAVLAAPVTAVIASVKQLAMIVENVPQAIFDYESAAAAFFESELSLRISQYLDSHIAAMILAATPPFGTTGADTVVKVRNAIAEMREIGQSPNVVVLNSADAVALDLLADAGGYILGPRDNTTTAPLWGLTVVERALGTDVPLLLDTNRLGVLYLGKVGILVDPFSGLKQNTVDIRLDLECFMHIRDASAAYRIAAT